MVLLLSVIVRLIVGKFVCVSIKLIVFSNVFICVLLGVFGIMVMVCDRFVIWLNGKFVLVKVCRFGIGMKW